MRHHIFSTADTYPVALLLRPTAFNKTEVMHHYWSPLQNMGLQEDVIAVTMDMGEAKKPTTKVAKDWITNTLPGLVSLGVKLLYVTDGTYFKALTKQKKAEPFAGYVVPCAIKGLEHIQVVLGLNYMSLIFNPELQGKLTASLQATVDYFHGTYQDPGSNIIKWADYPTDIQGIKKALLHLLQFPELTCDIEAFSLKFNEAGVGTISFAWDNHHGVAFPVDYVSHPAKTEDGHYGYQINNKEVKGLLREFFEAYTGNLTFHRATYDVKVLIYNLWMADMLDMPGLLKGLETMTRNLDDTLIIAYLAYNSTAGNVLGLKALAHEFAGNWAKDDIKDIRRIPLDELLQYNLVDSLSTFYVKKRDYPIMVADKQEDLYNTLMKDSLKLIIQIELTGMPMDMDKVKEVKQILAEEEQAQLTIIKTSPLIQAYNQHLRVKTMKMANSKLKVKQHPLSAFDHVEFNPNSNVQLQEMLYEHWALPVLDYTDSKNPATGGDTLEKLVNHTTDPDKIAVLKALVKYAGVNKILTSFIPAFEGAIVKSDGAYYLHGSFNIGGTVSGRLSSSDPNLQNIPAGSYYGKLIKLCFAAVTGWLFCGADFNSLEDYISALTTKDPNKLNVYLRGFDGHCLRAAYYFREQLQHIDLDDPASVNTIKKTHPELRQESKAPTFALTYQGTAFTLMNNLGWSEEQAKAVEANYHELYKVSDQYVQARLKQASKDGFVEVAFGLRVRTPLLAQVMWGQGRIPYEAQAEGRTAGNALGQSYGLLNNRAAAAFMKKVWASEFRYDIKPVALIHDAIYLLVRDDLRVVSWANKHLIQEMRWQELPEIQHNQVKLGAALDIFWPNWSNAITLPNDAPPEVIQELCIKAKEKVT